MPTGVAAADLNGDGLPDLFYGGNFTSGDTVVLHLLLTDGKGGYQRGTDVTLPVGTYYACLGGDVNGDGKTDLVCPGDEAHAEITVLPGNGDGTFAPAIVVPVPPLQKQLCDASYVSAIADLNNDGHPDVVVTCEIGGLVIPMLGDGTGHFTAAPQPVYAHATRIRLVDLNGDGKLDMVTQGILIEETQVLLGVGDGTFNTSQYWQSNYDSVLGDVDGDGHPDLIGGGFGVVRIFRGHSDGTFDTNATQVLDFTGGPPFGQLGRGIYDYPLACVDLNGDGHPDLVAFGGNGVTVFPGKGGLQFDAPRSFPEEQSITYGNFDGQFFQDVNGDGRPDYVAVGPSGLYLSYGQGDGSFVSGVTYASGRGVSDLTLADFNEDGAQDVITAGDLQLYLSLGKKDGSFADAEALPPKSPPMSGTLTKGWVSVAHGDVNGDGHQDLLAVGATQDGRPQLSLLLGHGDGSFDDPVAVQTVDGSPYTTVLDLNGDGRADVVLTEGDAVTVLLAQKDGTFQSVLTTLTAPGSEYAFTPVSLGDLNGDGVPDLAYVTTNHVAVAAGQGDGSFGAPVFYSLPIPSDVLSLSEGVVGIGDLDGDGNPDLAVLLPFEGPGNNDTAKAQIFVLYGQGKKSVLDADSFSAAVAGPISNQGYKAVYVADVDGDGRADVIAENSFGFAYPLTAEVARGRADRTLGDVSDIVDGYGEGPLSFADLNGDGRADLLKPNTYGNAFTVLLALQSLQPIGTLTATPTPVYVSGGFTMTATLAADGQSGPFEGTVTFAVDGKTIGSAALVNGSAALAGPASLTLGDHQLTAVTSIVRDGQGSYAPVSMAGTIRVVPLPVAVTISSSANPVIVTQSTTLVVQVQNGSGTPTGAPLPSGQVTVQVDGVTIGNGSSDGSSALTFSVPYPGAGVGTHAVTVTYPGDATHAAGSASLQEVVAPVPGSFSLIATPTAVTVSATKAASVQITATSVHGFFGPLALSYNGLPSGVTAQLEPATLTLTSGGYGTAMLSFTKTTAAQLQAKPIGKRPETLIAFAAMVLLLMPIKGRKLWKASLTTIALVCLGSGLNGCSTPRPPEVTSTPKTYTVIITGTGTGTNTTSTSATVALIVAQ